MSGMNQWHTNEIRTFRAEILTLLCVRHRNQMHRFHDAGLCKALQGMAIECTVYDVVTCLQDMADRDWVRFRSFYNRISNRTELSEIEIRPEGRDLCEQTRTHEALLFRRD
jgi:hypothetical protein